MDELKQKYGRLRRVKSMPKETMTQPAVIFKPVDPKRQIVKWDSTRALELWQKRMPEDGEILPDVFTHISDVTQAPEEIVGRNRLVLKAKDSEELMYYTTDDE